MPEKRERTVAATPPAQENSTMKNVTEQKKTVYKNINDDKFAAKLSRIRDDIESGSLDKLTLAKGRNYYQLTDARTREAQVILAKSGHLQRVGRQFRAA